MFSESLWHQLENTTYNKASKPKIQLIVGGEPIRTQSISDLKVEYRSFITLWQCDIRIIKNTNHMAFKSESNYT